MREDVRELIATGPDDRAGLRQLAALLPTDDEELDKWLSKAAHSGDDGLFSYLLAAAAMGGRKLKAWLLVYGLDLRMPAWHIAWTAWRSEGDVAEAVVHALAHIHADEFSLALVLFVATEWWQKHRAGKEVPRQIIRAASELADAQPIDAQLLAVLRGVAAVAGDEALAAKVWKGVKPRDVALDRRNQLKHLHALLEQPFENMVRERRTHDFISTAPRRRAAAHVGRNEPCPCGSGKKYKACCAARDLERLRHSSAVAGVTVGELHAEPRLGVTREQIKQMMPATLLCIDTDDVPEELQPDFVLRLAELKHYHDALLALQRFSQKTDSQRELPPHLYQAWRQVLHDAAEEWEPYVAKQLIELFPDAFEKLGETPDAGTNFLLEGTKSGELLMALEVAVIRLLFSRDLSDLQRLTRVLLGSHYKGIGILFARSLLPIVDEKDVPDLYDRILAARANFDLPPDDDFSDWMNERALRKAFQHETAAIQEAQDKLAAKMKELRATKEQLAKLQREQTLRERQAQREQKPDSTAAAEAEMAEERRTLKARIANLSSLVTERGSEMLELRRDLEKAHAALKAAPAEPPADAIPNEESDEFIVVEGNQPVRLIEFPRDFQQTLEQYPRHVGRAAMNRIGRIASGEPAAFDRVKQLKAYPEVLRARVADKYRLLFALTPDSVRVIDLIRRADLDRRIARLQTAGLPPVG